METKFRIFLLAAEELSFTSVAKKNYVSQQSISDHILKLEKEYGTELFIRKPKLALTAAGTALYEHFKYVRALEYNFKQKLDEIISGERGTIRVGFNATRARILLPSFLPHYLEHFPNVNVAVSFGDTQDSASLLQDGKLDMFFGINCKGANGFSVTPICTEGYFLVVSEKAFRSIYPNDYKKQLLLNSKNVQIDLLEKIPFVTNLSISSQSRVIQTLLYHHGMEYNIDAHTQLYISDFDTQFELCKEISLLAFCPNLIIDRVISLNEKEADPNRNLLLFPFLPLKNCNTVQIICRKEMHLPQYMIAFQQYLSQAIIQKRNDIKLYLNSR